MNNKVGYFASEVGEAFVLISTHSSLSNCKNSIWLLDKYFYMIFFIAFGFI